MAAYMSELMRRKDYAAAMALVDKSTEVGDLLVGEYLKALVKSDKISNYTAPGQLRHAPRLFAEVPNILVCMLLSDD